MSRIDAARPSGLFSSPSSPTPSSSSSSKHSRRASTMDLASDKWWEQVVPTGQLADRMRRAHDPTAARPKSSSSSSSSPTASSRSPSTIRSTVASSSSALQSMTRFAFPTFQREQQKVQQAQAAVSDGRDLDGFATITRSSSNNSADRTRSRVQSMDGFSSGRKGDGPSTSSANPARTKSTVLSSEDGSLRANTRAADRDRRKKAAWRHSVAISPMAPQGGSLSSSSSAAATRGGGLSHSSPSSSTDLLRPHHGLRGGHRSPLSRTPDLSSEEEELLPRAPHRSAPTNVNFAPSYAASLGSRASSSTSNLSSRSQSSYAGSMHDREWSDALRSRPSSRSTIAGSSRPRSRRVSFDLDGDTEGKDHTDEEREHRRIRTSRDSNGLGIVLPDQDGVTSSMPSSLHKTDSYQHLEALAASGSQHWFNTTSSATVSRRRTRAISIKDVVYSNEDLQRSASAPTSPKHSIHLTEAERARIHHEMAINRIHRQNVEAAASAASAQPRDRSTTTMTPQDVSVLRAIHHAQEQVSRTTHSALDLSRWVLSVPAPVVRPLIHLMLLWCVSSGLLMALAACLTASYMLTFWDDLGERGKGAHRTAQGWRKWTFGDTPRQPKRAGIDGVASSSTSSSRRVSTATVASLPLEAGRMVMDQILLPPLHYATKVPLAVARSLTPSVVPTPAASRRTSLSTGSGFSDHHEGGGYQVSSSFETASMSEPTSPCGQGPEAMPRLPPRPPLIQLLGSMILTLLLAIGAYLLGGGRGKSMTDKTGGESRATASTDGEFETSQTRDGKRKER